MFKPTPSVIPITRPLTLSVDSLLLDVAGRPLLVAAAELRSASVALRSAWAVAARALTGRHTGQALAAGQAGAFGALCGCTESLEAFGIALQRAAEVYRGADATAVGPSGTSG